MRPASYTWWDTAARSPRRSGRGTAGTPTAATRSCGRRAERKAEIRRIVKLTFCVKRDLYVGNGDGSRPFEGGSSRVVWGRNATAIGEPGPGAWGQAGCETGI